MNNFVICVGAYVIPLHKEAIATAKKMGTITVNMDGTACKVPDAAEYIAKIEARGSLGKKEENGEMLKTVI